MKSLDIDLKEFLEEKVLKFNHQNFIENDPISIPHKFEDIEDIEIAGFLTAIISPLPLLNLRTFLANRLSLNIIRILTISLVN